MEENKTCWVLAGPTASGKTAFSIKLAHEYGCEIVCMDSMQIYRRMNIGTAKPTLAEQDGVAHHMLDVAEPNESFSVARYQEMAEEAIEGIHSRGRRALLVGGTGLYLRAMRHPMAMGAVQGNEELRRELETVAEQTNGRERIHKQLTDVDPATAARLHVNDVRRVIRALEVYKLTGVPFSQQPVMEEKPRFHYRVAALNMERKTLYQRIESRVDKMIACGLADEVRALLDEGVPPDAQAMRGLGYKELIPYIKGEISLEQAIYDIKLGTRHYAKRQLTWMRREEDVCWVDAMAPDVYQQLKAWYIQGG